MKPKPTLVPYRKGSPTPGDVHVNTPLTNVSVAFLQAAANFVAPRIFPMVPVVHQSDSYYTYPRDSFFRDEMKKRGPGARAERVDYNVTPASYAADVWALAKYIDDQTRANADSAIDLDRDAVNLLTQKAMISLEVQWASQFMIGGVWTGSDLDGVAATPTAGQFLQWNDPNSQPIEDMRAGKLSVLQKTGMEPNKLVLGVEVYTKLIDHPDIVGRLDRGQTSGPAMANAADLARILDLEEVLIMRAVQNTAAEGATAAFGFIGGKDALLAYVPPAPGLMVPSAGYTFGWNGYLGAAGMGQRISRFREDPEHSDIVELEMAYVHKLVAGDLGAFFDTAVA